MAHCDSHAGCVREQLDFHRDADHGENHGRCAACASRVRPRPHRGTVVDTHHAEDHGRHRGARSACDQGCTQERIAKQFTDFRVP